MLARVFDVSYPARAGVLARRVDALSAEVGTRAHRLAAASGTGGWAGPAAHSFRCRAQELVVQLRHAANCLEHAATAVRRHGAAVQRRLEESGER